MASWCEHEKVLSPASKSLLNSINKQGITMTTNTTANANDSGYAVTTEADSNAITKDHYSRASTNGNRSHATTNGDYSPAVTTGEFSHASTNGESSNAVTTRNHSRASTNGDFSHASTNGDFSHAVTTGVCSIACTLGNQSRAKAGAGGAIILARFTTSGKFIHFVSRVGENGVLPDTFYTLTDAGELVLV